MPCGCDHLIVVLQYSFPFIFAYRGIWNTLVVKCLNKNVFSIFIFLIPFPYRPYYTGKFEMICVSLWPAGSNNLC